MGAENVVLNRRICRTIRSRCSVQECPMKGRAQTATAWSSISATDPSTTKYMSRPIALAADKS